MRYVQCLAAALLLATPWTQAGSDEVVKAFHGYGQQSNLAFGVQGDWELRWKAEGDEQFPGLSRLRVQLRDADTGRFLGIVANGTGSSSGRRVMTDGGRYYIDVLGRNIRWSIQIADLDEPWARANVAPNDAESMRAIVMSPPTAFLG